MFILRKFRSILNKQDISRPENNYRNDIEESHEADEEENDIDHIEIGLSADTINTKMKTEELELKFPSIYVDEKVLNRFTGHPYKERDKDKIVFNYEINGVVFWDDVNVDDKLMRFEIKDYLKDNDEALSDLMQGFGAARNFQITIQKTPYGLIINSNIVVSENAWNTIVCGDETTCIACNKELDIREIADHIATDNHKHALDKFKPLDEFEMNIVRNIDDKYHCGICNTTFYDEHHVESVSHGDKFLRALNKVSDIQIENAIPDNRNESHGNRNAIDDSSGFDSESFDGFYDDVRPTDYNDSDTDDKDTRYNDPNLFSYADVAKKPKTFETSEYVEVKLDDRTAKVKFDCWHMISIKLKTNTFYCMACKVDGPVRDKSKHCLGLDHVENLMKCSIVNDFKEHVVRKVDDKLHHCGHCNYLKMRHEMKDHLETNHKKYVMTNITSEREPLSKCTVIKSSPKAAKKNNSAFSAASSVESKDEKLGNVEINNPTLRSHSPAIANPANHPAKTIDGIAVPSNQAIPSISANPTQTANLANTVPGGSATLPPNQFVQNPVLPIQNIIVRAFNQVYRLSDLAFNSIQLWPKGYFCLICEMWCPHDVRRHLVEPIHRTRIVHAPFLPHTSFHLIRPTKYGFHCVICDILMRSDPINHTWDRMHLAILGTALNSQNIHPVSTPVLHQKQTTVETSNQNILTVKNEIDKESGTTEKETTDNGTENEIGVKEIEKDFDCEGYLYVKVKNIYTKITMTAFNGLVQTGSGARYCVLCSVDVFPQDLKTHVFTKGHILNLEQTKFLKKYERHLLRQLSSYYHCALCNVCVLKKFLNKHLVWEPHTECESRKIVMHERQNEIKAGVEEVTCSTQKDDVNAPMENDFKVLVNIKFELLEDFSNRVKIVNINGVVITLSWYAFHGILKRKNGYRCIICQDIFKANEMSSHVEKPMHSGMLENFLLEHSPALIRKINDVKFHCLTCNVEVINDKQINDHKVSKSHTTKYASTVANKSNYDVSSDVLTLKGNNSKKKKKNT